MGSKFKQKYLLVLFASIIMGPYTFAADQTIEQRVSALEAKTEGNNQGNQLTFSGVIEVEASYSDPDSGDSESDLVVATAELGAEGAITDQLSATLTLLYEEDEGSVDVDIATMSYVFNNGFSIVLGQEYVPFGSYGTELVNDTLALALGETRETGLMVQYEQGGFNSAVYVFNGDNDENQEQEINDYGARISFSHNSFTVGGDYISNLGDSDGLTDAIDYTAQKNAISGGSFFAELHFGPVSIFAEHLSALDEYTPENSEPSASQLEMAYSLGEFTYAVSYQETDEANFLGLSEERVSVGFNTEILGGLGLGIELGRDEDYAGDTTTNFVLQLAAEF